MADLVERFDPRLAGGTLGDDQRPDRLHLAVPGLGHRLHPAVVSGAGCLDRVGRVGLAVMTASLAVGPVDLDHLDTGRLQIAGQSRAIRAGALHPNPGRDPERVHPLQQLPIAGPAGREGFHSQQAADVVQDRGNVHIEMRIDSTGHPAGAF